MRERPSRLGRCEARSGRRTSVRHADWIAPAHAWRSGSAVSRARDACPSSNAGASAGSAETPPSTQERHSCRHRRESSSHRGGALSATHPAGAKRGGSAEALGRHSRRAMTAPHPRPPSSRRTRRLRVGQDGLPQRGDRDVVRGRDDLAAELSGPLGASTSSTQKRAHHPSARTNGPGWSRIVLPRDHRRGDPVLELAGSAPPSGAGLSFAGGGWRSPSGTAESLPGA
jgi:hypothetical protein